MDDGEANTDPDSELDLLGGVETGSCGDKGLNGEQFGVHRITDGLPGVLGAEMVLCKHSYKSCSFSDGFGK